MEKKYATIMQCLPPASPLQEGSQHPSALLGIALSDHQYKAQMNSLGLSNTGNILYWAFSGKICATSHSYYPNYRAFLQRLCMCPGAYVCNVWQSRLYRLRWQQVYRQGQALQPHTAHHCRLLAQHPDWQTAWWGTVIVAVHHGPAEQAALPELESKLQLQVFNQDKHLSG